ncbi:Predicted kinase, aminoglycoside phosphotransferase (APT) family [Tistlia consotensis]|uniref:Predicted kinase, aminoglycoside phosphotransferase (APT) family n=1 Tax=Tistlia consotensis USBA 355 TaxID=560819 RepID=A0A1Y6C2Z8_9PROT|nr:phosphotransferase [Tistlia consotensis]SMF39059.1 Predicted kinase, aminoglycoside phosphotransferase (APT) family [Tistlia consotensis USBA 355]SNR36577.1 Predicted kinase, aminoglycoside phosphotransferase (APT) family [Tistlia consotensis]
MLDLDRLAEALAGEPRYGGRPLAPLTDKGLAHDHVRLPGSGLLLRIPKQSQFGYAAADNLAYQAACFERVAASGHGPRLDGVIAPGPGLPMGALAVEEIAGRPAVLPSDLPALAEALAAVHALGLPPADKRPPLEDHEDPVAGALAEIRFQAGYLGRAEDLDLETARLLRAELAWAEAFAAEAAGHAQPRRLVLTDTHPGNFLVRPDGRAVIVDLEKALYGAPAIDLAHATVFTSTTWDLESRAELTVEEVAGFYQRYLEAAGPEAAGSLRPWLLPLRRILALRALTWCVLWSVEHRRERRDLAASAGRDWAAGRSDEALIAHVAGRVAEYLRPATVEAMGREAAALGQLL